MKALKKYLEKRERAIAALLKKDVRSCDPLAVHAIRVEIKKMSAFFHLINYAVRAFKRKKTFKPLKVVFRQAGKLRDLQVEEAMLKKYAIKSLPNDYLKGLKRQRLQEQREFSTIISSKYAARLKETCHKLYSFVAKADRKKVFRYLKWKRKKIDRLVAKSQLQTPELHKLRKQIKDLEYNRTSVGRKSPKSQSVKANALPILLGKWHDCQVIIRHLEKVTLDCKKHPKELAQLKRITKEIAADREFLLDRIENTLAAPEILAINKTDH